MAYIYKLTLLEDVGPFKKGCKYVGQHNGKRSEYFTGGKLPKDIIKSKGVEIFNREILCSGDFNCKMLDE